MGRLAHRFVRENNVKLCDVVLAKFVIRCQVVGIGTVALKFRIVQPLIAAVLMVLSLIAEPHR